MQAVHLLPRFYIAFKLFSKLTLVFFGSVKLILYLGDPFFLRLYILARALLCGFKSLPVICKLVYLTVYTNDILVFKLALLLKRGDIESDP